MLRTLKRPDPFLSQVLNHNNGVEVWKAARNGLFERNGPERSVRFGKQPSF